MCIVTCLQIKSKTRGLYKGDNLSFYMKESEDELDTYFKKKENFVKVKLARWNML